MLEGRYSQFTGSANEFHEKNYLLVYADVRELVKNGKYRSGAHHYWAKGIYEKRQKNPNPNATAGGSGTMPAGVLPTGGQGAGGAPVVQGPKPDSIDTTEWEIEIPDPNFSSKWVVRSFFEPISTMSSVIWLAMVKSTNFL